MCGEAAPAVRPIGNSLPHQTKELFNRNEETLKKLHDRLAFQQLHLDICLLNSQKKLVEMKSQIATNSRKLADKRQELNDLNQSIKKKSQSVKHLKEVFNNVGLGPRGRGGRF